MNFVLVNESTVTDAKYGGALDGATLILVAAALGLQLARDVYPVWGGVHAVRAGLATDVQAGEIVCAIVDSLPDAPGAVAYHSIDGTDVPTVFVARTECTALVSGASSLSAALSHELIEATGNPAIDLWVDDGAGHEWARELCDGCQEGSYAVNGIAVSDFLLPAFFAPSSSGPYSFLGARGENGAPNAPFATAPGGYQLQRASGGGETQIDGRLSVTRAAHVAHWSSRVSRIQAAAR